MSIEPAVPTPLRWSDVPITFSRVDQWTSFSEPGRFPLVLKPVVAGSRINKVLIDGGSGLNVLFTKTLKKMKLDITHMLTKSNTPFYGIVPGNAAIPLGSVVLPVTFRESRDNYHTEYVKFEVVDFETSYHAILGRPAIAKFMVVQRVMCFRIANHGHPEMALGCSPPLPPSFPLLRFSTAKASRWDSS
jgi:hypothetical protein